MECGCSIEVDYDGGDGPEFFQEADHKARKQHKCCECKRTIEPDEVYRKESGRWNGGFESYKTCLDCLSMRQAFFCGFYYEQVWQMFRDEMFETGGDFNQTAMAKLTPAAREKACEIVEGIWKDEDEEADEDAA